MRMYVALVAATLCTACAADTPIQPAPPQPSRTAVTNILIDFTTGIGRATVVARVINAYNDPIPGQPVSFSADVGTVSPAAVTTDSFGKATTILVSPISTKLQARAGGISAESPIAIQGAVEALPPASPPVTSPTPTPPSTTPAPTPTPVLHVTFECAPSAGHVAACHVAMIGADGSNLTATITSVDWNWGDGNVTSGMLITTSHTYAVPGSFLIVVAAHAPAGTASSSVTLPVP